MNLKNIRMFGTATDHHAGRQEVGRCRTTGKYRGIQAEYAMPSANK